MNISKSLIRLARLVVAKTVKVNERSNLEREFANAIRNGDTVEFEYTKKDGSKKKREIVPVQVFKMRGKPVVKGYEVRDPRQVEKVFYLNMIGDIQEEEKPIEEQIRVPSGFGFLQDDGIARSLSGLIRSNGQWKSAKQAQFLLSKISRGGFSYKPNTLWASLEKEWKSKAVGIVITSRQERGDWINWGVYVVDAEGVLAHQFVWARKFVKEYRHDRMEDLYDDFGGKRHNIPDDLYEEYQKNRYTVSYSTVWKNGIKTKWKR